VTVYCTLLLLKGWTMGGYLATRQPVIFAIFLAELVSLAFVPLPSQTGYRSSEENLPGP